MTLKKMISFEGTSNLKEALRVEAFKQGTTVSAVIRKILEKQLGDTLEKCRQDDVKRG